MIHTLVKYLLLQQLLVYHQANIVDEMNHILDDQDDSIFPPSNKIDDINLIIMMCLNWYHLSEWWIDQTDKVKKKNLYYKSNVRL